MNQPIILITPFLSKNTDGEKQDCESVKLAYNKAILVAGGIPILVSFNTSEDGLKKLARVADGLFLPGGDDVDPELYGLETSENILELSPERDKLELSLIKIFLELGKPIFGVCRGMQILNVALNGTLYVDIKNEIPGALTHRDYSKPIEEKYEIVHSACFSADSTVGSWFTEEQIPVNSVHHQAVKELGKGLRISAVAEDGVVELIESENMKKNWMLGVQWHPEELLETNPEQKVLFEKFIEATTLKAEDT